MIRKRARRTTRGKVLLAADDGGGSISTDRIAETVRHTASVPAVSERGCARLLQRSCQLILMSCRLTLKHVFMTNIPFSPFFSFLFFFGSGVVREARPAGAQIGFIPRSARTNQTTGAPTSLTHPESERGLALQLLTPPLSGPAPSRPRPLPACQHLDRCFCCCCVSGEARDSSSVQKQTRTRTSSGPLVRTAHPHPAPTPTQTLMTLQQAP